MGFFSLSGWSIRTHILIAKIFWTVLVVALFAFETYDHYKEDFAAARKEAQTAFEKDLLYRSWSGMHSELYVPVTEQTRPNPLLAAVPDRDITTPSGKKFTLMSPAYMSRKALDLGSREHGIISRLTSLKPLNPDNAPDPWENQALRQLAEGKQEISSEETIQGKRFLRFMRPIFTEKTCLKCHASQGYREGDIRGGISIAIPLHAHISSASSIMFSSGFVFLTIWAAGFLSITAGARHIMRKTTDLEESERRFRNLFTSMQDGVYQTDEQGIVTLMNPAGAAIFGYPDAPAVVGRPLGELLPNDSSHRFLVRLHENGLLHAAPVTGRTQDGGEIHLEITGMTMTDDDGTLRGFEGVFRDVTEQVQAEQKIRALNRTMREIIDSAPLGIYVIRQDGRTEFVNPAMLRISGATLGQFMSSNLLDLPTYRESGLADAIRRGFEGESFRLDHVRYTSFFAKKTTWRNLLGIPLLEDGMSKVLVFVEDITAQVEAEERQQSLQSQLIQSQKIESIGRLAGGIAHDFNNILSAIIGFGELALLGMKEGDPLREKLQIITSAGHKAAALTHQLLAFSRKQVLSMAVTGVNEIIESMSKMFTRLIGEDIVIQIRTRHPLKPVLADRTQIEQVLMNLVLNARDAMPSGGSVLIETDEVVLDEEFARIRREVLPGQYVVMSVTDTGTGMSSDVQERIFDPFFTTKEVGKGTGLGLATVYGIVKQHNGYIYVSSEPGAGTTFRVYLPVTSGSSTEEKETNPALVSGSETIMVIDDDRMILQLVLDSLGPLGYRLLTASDSDEAFQLSAATDERIHLILTDVVMPKVNGKVLAERIRKLHPEAQTLFMSGYTDEAIVRYGVLEKGIHLIKKPLTPKKLAEKVREVLDAGSKDQRG